MPDTARPKASQLTNEIVADHRASYYWFKGDNCNFNPTLWDMRAHDAIEQNILKGWLPAQPFIDRTTKITAFGSCFAEHSARHLAARNYNLLNADSDGDNNSYLVSMKEGLVNTFAIRQQFEWALENKQPKTDLWYGYKAEAFGYDERIRLATRDLILRSDVFLLTFGVSEVWYDEPTGEVFWRAVPIEKYDPSRHKFRVSTVEENRDNIRAIYDLLAKHVPHAKLVCTLSPIPLIATFRPNTALTSNAVSKAILRAALDDVYRAVAHEGRMHYWPSYDIVLEGFGISAYGGRFVGDRRHVNEAVLAYIMRLFEEHYCVEPAASKSVMRLYFEARCATLDIPPFFISTIDSGDFAAISAAVKERLEWDDRPTAEFLVKLALERNPAGGYEALLVP